MRENTGLLNILKSARNIIISVIIGLAYLGGSSQAAETDNKLKVSGSLELFSAVYLEDKKGSENQYLEMRFSPSVTYTPNENFLLHIEGDFRTDTNNYAKGYLNDVIEQNNRWILNLRQGYLEYSNNMLRVRAGKQVFNWCVTDTVCPNDNINPRDYKDIIRWDRVGVAALDVKFGGDTYIDGVVIPWLTPSKMPSTGTRWERDLPPALLNSDNQEFNRGAAQIAVRAGMNHIEGFDFGASYYRGYSFSPSFRLDPISPVQFKLVPIYSSEEVYALSVSRSINEFNARAEVGYFKQKNEDIFIQYVLGVDREWTNLIKTTDSFYVLLQYSNEAITKHQSLVPFKTIDFRRIFSNSLMTKVRYSPGDSSRWVFNIDGSYNLTDKDYYLQPSITYTRNKTEIKGGLQVMGGKQETFFGGYHSNDRAFLTFIYYF